MSYLKDKVIVITGAAGVLCSNFAQAFAQDGAKVALLDLNLEGAQKIADGINANGGIAAAFQCNVLEPASVQAAAEAVQQKFGVCDILLNGAGGNNSRGNTDQETFGQGGTGKTFFDIDPAGFQFVLNLNMVGTVIPSQVFARQMLGREGSSIINISSMSAPSPMTKVPAYSAAKAGISNFTQWMAVYFADSSIRVNAIAPGFLVTNQNHDLLLNADGSLTERGHKILNHTPQRRFGDPEDLVGALKFLMDYEQSKFITGVVIPIDGGFMAYSGV